METKTVTVSPDYDSVLTTLMSLRKSEGYIFSSSRRIVDDHSVELVELTVSRDEESRTLPK